MTAVLVALQAVIVLAATGLAINAGAMHRRADSAHLAPRTADRLHRSAYRELVWAVVAAAVATLVGVLAVVTQ